MECLNCNTETTNAKFCSNSCTSMFYGKTRPKSWTCKICKEKGKQRASNNNKICDDCLKIQKSKTKEHCAWHLCLNRLTGRQTKYCSKSCKVKSRVTSHRREVKIKAVALKGGSCVHCGYNKCIASLHFHHIEDDKEFAISSTGDTRSWEAVLVELEKCELICANCHGEIHYKEQLALENITQREGKKALNKKKEIVSKPCKGCGIDFRDDRGGRKFCKNECRLKYQAKAKFTITKEELENLVKIKPLTEIGKLYDVTDNAVKKWCKDYGIETHPKGYWAKVAAGKIKIEFNLNP